MTGLSRASRGVVLRHKNLNTGCLCMTNLVRQAGMSGESSKLQTATGIMNNDVGVKLLALCVDACGIDLNGDKSQKIMDIFHALAALEPKDEIEGMLLTRMVALHDRGMKMLAVNGSKDLSPQVVELYANMGIKLMRLYNESLDALMRYRRRGEQRVVVQHVTVEGGGKAVVGTILAGAGGERKLEGQPHG